MYQVGTVLTLSAWGLEGAAFKYWTCSDPSEPEAGAPSELTTPTFQLDVTQAVDCVATIGQ